MQCAYWKDYCEFEIENGDEAIVKSLFGKCLLLCLDIDLWKMYVGFIRSLNADREDSPEGIMEVKTCLEFALEQVGQDVRAGELWQEYFDLLQSVQEDSPAYEKVFGEAVEGQADAAKTAALRRGMHKALNIPTTSLDAIWSMYEQFENSLGNKTLSKRSLDEWRPKYHASKAVSNERWSLVESLDTKMLPLPPGKGGHHQLEEAQKWRKYCHWESDNPGEADRPTHQARIVLAYEQSLSYLIQFPDVWLDYASWHMSETGMGAESAIAVLNRGREALPAALVLHFEVADVHEQMGNIDKARSIYEEVVAEDSEEEAEEKARTDDLKTLGWIQYMRFVRRVDGVMAARKLFLRARKWSGLQWQAFVASARFEWLNDGKDHIPRNIFELGLKTYLKCPGYVVEYAKFLMGIGDLANTRSLFERAITATPPEETGPLWDAYIEFEAESGSLSTVSSLESRRKEALKEEAKDPLDALHVSLLKHKFLDIVPGTSDMFEVSPDMYAYEEYDEYYYGQGEQEGYPPGQPPPPPPPGGRPPPPRPMGGARVPRDLHQLMKQLHGPAEGPVPDVEHILTPIMNFDFTAAGIESHEAAMGRPIQSLDGGKKVSRSGKRRGSKRKGTQQPNVPEPPPHPDDHNVDDGDNDDEIGDDMPSAGSDVYRRRMRKRT